MSVEACPDAGVLHDLADGALAAEHAAEVRRHLDGCNQCLAAMGALLASSSGGGSQSAEPLDLVGAEIGDRYEVAGRIGAGATAVVYEAWDRTLERTVALKTVATTGDARADRLRDRLVAESKALAKLQHPNVVAVHDVLIHGDMVVIAMERIDGQTLRAWAERRTPAEVVRVVADAARGLAAAHAVGIVHRDFKPENVLVTRDDRPLVVDFGLARTRLVADAHATSSDIDAPLTATGWVVGTPAYMPPEQWSGDAADHSADVYAVCVTAYELVTGQRPYRASTAEKLQAAKLRGEFTPLPRTLPPRARRAIESGLHPDPAQRPTTILSVAGDLSAKAPNVRTRAAWAVAVASVAGAAIVVSTSQPVAAVDEPCAGEPPAAIRDETRVRATGLDGAATFEPALDRYALEHTAAWTRACGAGGVEGKLERSCLETQRLRIDTALGLFAEGALSLRDLQARIPSPGDCRAEAIGAKLPPPDPAIADAVAALRARLVVLEERLLAGLHEDARRGLDALLVESASLEHAPLDAELEYWRGMADVFAGDVDAGRPHLLAAARLAVTSGHHSVSARAWLELMSHELKDGAVDLERADEYAGMARASLDALGAGPWADSLEALYALRVAYRHSNAGDEEAALRAYQQVLALSDADDEDIAAAHEGIAMSYRELGRFDESARAAQASLELRVEARGPNSLAALYSHYNLAAALVYGERYDEADAQIERGLDVATALGSAGDGMRLHLLNLRQHVYLETDRDAAEMQAHFDALRAALNALDEPDPLLIASLEESEAGFAFRRGEYERVARHVDAGLAATKGLSPADELSTSLQVLGIFGAYARGDGSRVRTLATGLEQAPALETVYRELGPYYAGSADLAYAMTALERARMDLAEPRIEQALAAFEGDPDLAPSAVHTREVWARALWDAGRRQEARQVAVVALGLLRDIPTADRPPSADAFERWARTHGITSPQPGAEPVR